jgi:hypothetical protein
MKFVSSENINKNPDEITQTLQIWFGIANEWQGFSKIGLRGLSGGVLMAADGPESHS